MKLDTDKIKKELDRIGKSQSDMANDLQFTRQHISYIMKRKRSPRFGTIEMLAKYFGMDPKDLITND